MVWGFSFVRFRDKSTSVITLRPEHFTRDPKPNREPILATLIKVSMVGLFLVLYGTISSTKVPVK